MLPLSEQCTMSRDGWGKYRLVCYISSSKRSNVFKQMLVYKCISLNSNYTISTVKKNLTLVKSFKFPFKTKKFTNNEVYFNTA